LFDLSASKQRIQPLLENGESGDGSADASEWTMAQSFKRLIDKSDPGSYRRTASLFVRVRGRLYD